MIDTNITIEDRKKFKKEAEQRFMVDVACVVGFAGARGCSFSKKEVDQYPDTATFGVCYIDKKTGEYKLLKYFSKHDIVSYDYRDNLDDPMFLKYVESTMSSNKHRYICYLG